MLPSTAFWHSSVTSAEETRKDLPLAAGHEAADLAACVEIVGHESQCALTSTGCHFWLAGLGQDMYAHCMLSGAGA